MMAGALPPFSNRIDFKSLEETQQRLSDENFFDKMMKRNNSMAMHLAFEPILAQMFQADRVIVWLGQNHQINSNEDINNTHFYSPTLNKEIKETNSLIIATSYVKTSINCIFIDNQTTLNQLNIEPQTPNLFFPLYLRTGPVIAVCHLTRNPGSIPFGELELQQSYFLTRKFRIYGTCTLNAPRTISLASEVSIVSFPHKCILKMTKSLKNSFLCKEVDFWIYHTTTNTFARFDKDVSNFVVKQSSEVGIVSHALRAKQFINERMCKYHVNYKKEIDGDPNSPIIVGYDEFDDQIYAVALRGRSKNSPFSIDDYKRLVLVMPFISRSLAFSFKFTEFDQSTSDSLKSQQNLGSVLDFSSEITQIKDLFTLITKIQERAPKLINCKSSKLLIVDESKSEFKFNFNKNYNQSCKKPLNNGIAGKVLKLQEPVISNKPETDPFYDSEVDSMLTKNNREKSATPQNILSVPIFSSYDKVIAVLTLFNKQNNQDFDESDEDLASAFTVFCGISLQNTSLFQSSLMILNELKEFSNLLKEADFTRQDSVYELLESLFNISNEIIHSSRLSLFLINNDTLFEFMTVDGELNANSQLEEVSLDYAQESKLKGKTLTFQIKEKNKVICCTPLFSADHLILGVIEFCCEIFELQNGIELIESFSNMAAILFEKSHLKLLSDLGQAFYDVNNSISVYDLSTYEMPSNLLLKLSSESNLFKIDFDISSYPENFDLLKVLFTIFNDSEIRIELKIPNQNLFYFLNELSNHYRPIEYFNWRHAVNSFQYVYYILKNLKNEVHFTSEEILSLFVASISHDVDHNGFLDFGIGLKTRRSSKTANAAFEKLFNDQKVLEIHHCSETIKILTKNECSLFSDSDDLMWKNIFDLILSTNMGKHFDLVHSFQEYFEKKSSSSSINNKKNFFLKLVNEDNKFRSLFMQMIIKAADLSDCCRAFKIADLFKKFVPLEFFYQGKIDDVKDFEFWGIDDSQDSNVKIKKNRTRLKQNASTIPFYKNVCLPFFESLSVLCPLFEESVSILSDNIKKWESEPIEKDDIIDEVKKEIENEKEKELKNKEKMNEEVNSSKSHEFTKITFNKNDIEKQQNSSKQEKIVTNDLKNENEVKNNKIKNTDNKTNDIADNINNENKNSNNVINKENENENENKERIENNDNENDNNQKNNNSINEENQNENENKEKIGNKDNGNDNNQKESNAINKENPNENKNKDKIGNRDNENDNNQKESNVINKENQNENDNKENVGNKDNENNNNKNEDANKDNENENKNAINKENQNDNNKNEDANKDNENENKNAINKENQNENNKNEDTNKDDENENKDVINEEDQKENENKENIEYNDNENANINNNNENKKENNIENPNDNENKEINNTKENNNKNDNNNIENINNNENNNTNKNENIDNNNNISNETQNINNKEEFENNIANKEKEEEKTNNNDIKEDAVSDNANDDDNESIENDAVQEDDQVNSDDEIADDEGYSD